jgi:maleate isomerase
MAARIGLIIPSSNRMVEQEMVHYFPPGAHAHVMRLRMTGRHHVELEALLPRIEEATATLTDARCEVIAFHCTATSMEEGMAGEERVLAAMARGGAPRATTTAIAIRRAFDALGARRIGVVTPYDAAKTADEAAFLRAAGYDVLDAVGFALAGSDAFCAAPAQFWRDRVLEIARPDAQAYLISCANIAAFAIIDALEQELDRPVVTSNQAVLWDALCRLGWSDHGDCPGRLFAQHAGCGGGGCGRIRQPITAGAIRAPT